ncbi:MAG: prepilin peptidase [Anaerolineae bacterium]|nr:prepilin peptidase [Anaerolineae bacterium]
MLILLWGALGVALAAALNPLADRLPKHARLSLQSVCPYCGSSPAGGQPLAIVALLAGRLRCRACRSRLPARRWLFELCLGLLFALLAWRYGWSIQLPIASLHAAALALIAVTDLEERIVPDAVLLPAALFAILSTLALSPSQLPNRLLAGAVGFGIFLALRVLKMGWGDVKLAGYVGLIAGYPRVFACLTITALAGGLAAAALLLTRRAQRRSYIPYAPYLVLGALLAVLVHT